MTALAPTLSLEVQEYLTERGIALPDCPPSLVTPHLGRTPGARFFPDRVDRVLTATSYMVHTQGRLAGQPLRLDPWQVAYIVAPIFGWCQLNEFGEWVRIVRRVWIEVPRKNGKTTLSGSLALYLLAADGEAGAQVLAVASRKDQARFCFDPVKQIAENSKNLRGLLRTFQSKIVHPKSGSSFSVIASVGEAIHGANVHGAIVDEVHVHRDPGVIEAVETGVGSRTQPLVICITTADDGRPETVYAHRRKYVDDLVSGVIEDPRFYGVVWCAGTEDDPFDEATWRKANPGLGVSPTLDYLRTAANQAKNSPVDLASFQRLHLGIRVSRTGSYLKLSDWDSGISSTAWEDLYGRWAYGGLDLASTSDICALCWLLPAEAGSYDAVWRLWVPEAALTELDKRTAKAASTWVTDGWLRTTPGNTTDYDHIKTTIDEDMRHLNVHSIAYDRWNASQLVTDLSGMGANMAPIGQGFASMSAPMKEMQRLVLRHALRHQDNPALRWMVHNLSVSVDAAENVKPDKATSGDKIDGISALAMALDGAMRGDGGSSVYEERAPYVF